MEGHRRRVFRGSPSGALDGSDDASAQNPTMVRSVTADTDSQQLRQGRYVGSSASCATSIYEISPGPFVLTDAQYLWSYGGTGSLGSDAHFFTVDASTTCASVGMHNGISCNILGTTHPVYTASLEWFRASASDATVLSTLLHGGRHVVPSGKRLCVSMYRGAVEWAGFVPYQ